METLGSLFLFVKFTSPLMKGVRSFVIKFIKIITIIVLELIFFPFVIIAEGVLSILCVFFAIKWRDPIWETYKEVIIDSHIEGRKIAINRYRSWIHN